MLNTQLAASALQASANNNSITATQITNMLANVSVTFANITTVTKVATAAAHKAINIVKVTNANVQLFSNINAATSVFTRAVKKSAAKHASNNMQAVAAFKAQANYFVHTACYSLTQHNANAAQQYLYCIYNNAKSAYFINNVLATKQQVAQYLTASAAQQLLQKDNTVRNVTNNITHNVQVRNIMLSSIVAIKARKQVLLK